ncbi:MAG: hypothetical protein OXC60_01450 [Litoreibacter sp.]|nr:hypothetical protein [Litoreibacter sp.]
MRKPIIVFVAFGLFSTLAACDNDFERGAVGAGAGAAVSVATGGSIGTGALVGGVAGVFCDDLGICG